MGTGSLIGVWREGNICEIAVELVWLLLSNLVFILMEKYLYFLYKITLFILYQISLCLVSVFSLFQCIGLIDTIQIE